MTNLILIAIVCGVCSFVGAYVSVRTRRLIIKVDENKKEITIKPAQISKSEFVEDATQEELDEMSRPSKLRKFLNKFVKSND